MNGYVIENSKGQFWHWVSRVGNHCFPANWGTLEKATVYPSESIAIKRLHKKKFNLAPNWAKVEPIRSN